MIFDPSAGVPAGSQTLTGTNTIAGATAINSGKLILGNFGALPNSTINVNTNLIVNREAAPFNNADLRKAMALSLDRKSMIDIILQGRGDAGGSLLPPPWA